MQTLAKVSSIEEYLKSKPIQPSGTNNKLNIAIIDKPNFNSSIGIAS